MILPLINSNKYTISKSSYFSNTFLIYKGYQLLYRVKRGYFIFSPYLLDDLDGKTKLKILRKTTIVNPVVKVIDNGKTVAKIEKLLFSSSFNITSGIGDFSVTGDFCSSDSTILCNRKAIGNISMIKNNKYSVFIKSDKNNLHILAIIIAILISRIKRNPQF